jgi:selenocysteine-specific elongation factor
LIRKHGVIDEAELEATSGVGTGAIGEATEGAADAVQDGFIFARGALGAFEKRITDELRRFHDDNPLAAGMPMGQLKRTFPSPALDTVLTSMQDYHKVVIDGSVARLPDHKGARLTVDERLAADNALGRLRDADASPPEFSEAGLTIDLARALERNGELVFLTPAIAYPSDVWADIEKRVVGFIIDNGSATVAQIRDAVGTTRKYAVPLLEKLDATGVTRRKGDIRELGPRGRELAGH